jgi:O-antigen ligase
MPGINVLLVGLACMVAFVRPTWGFGIILLTTSTLFHLDQYLTVPLPLGFIEPMEVLLVSMMAAIWLKGWLAPQARTTAASTGAARGIPDAHMWLAIGLYCLWQTLCIVFALSHWSGTEHFRLAIRFLVSAILPWTSLYILRRLPTIVGHKVFQTAYYLTLLTAVVHIALQLTDFRPAMQAAYWWIPENTEYNFAYVQQWIKDEAFVRGLPQGILLILFFAVLKASEFILERNQRTIRNLSVAVILFSALFITVTRSLMACLAAGLLILLGLAAFTVRLRMSHVIRITGLLAVFMGAALLYNGLRPGFFDFWSARMVRLSGVDSDIFSEDNEARGRDNLAAMAAIADNPVFGLGTPRYPDEYSLRSGPPTDTHPLLEIGLVGGIPAILLILSLQVCLFLPALKKARRNASAARELVPFVAILMMSAFAVNMIGGGGTIVGPPILFVTIFANEMWYHYSRTQVAGVYRIRKENNGTARYAAHFRPDAIVQPGAIYRTDHPISAPAGVPTR